MEKRKGVQVELYDIVNYNLFYAERKKCGCHHDYHAYDDEIGEDHCTRSCSKEYVEGKSDHRQCIDCSPENCISEIVKRCLRNEASLVKHMTTERKARIKEREDEINGAKKLIREAHEDNAKTLEDIDSISELKLKYNNPLVKKVLKLAK